MRDKIQEALYGKVIADKVGLDFEVWNSVDHVFDTMIPPGYALATRRMPVFIIKFESQDFQRIMIEGGTLNIKVTITLHHNSRGGSCVFGGVKNAFRYANDAMNNLMATAFAEIRKTAQHDNYFQSGDDSIGSIETGPYGLKLDGEMNFQFSWNTGEYGTIN